VDALGGVRWLPATPKDSAAKATTRLTGWFEDGRIEPLRLVKQFALYQVDPRLRGWLAAAPARPATTRAVERSVSASFRRGSGAERASLGRAVRGHSRTLAQGRSLGVRR
jgi:hypothetical protein